MYAEHQDVLRIVLDGGGLTRLPEPVQLASGELSRYFIDGKYAVRAGADLKTVCQAMINSARALDVEWDAVGGLTMGADHFSHGISILTGCEWFSVRKAPKGRGTNKLIEGAQLRPSTRVLLVDDVVTSGGSIQTAFHEIDATGAPVVLAVTLVDRGQVAGDFFRDRAIPYRPLLTYVDLGIPEVGKEGAARPGQTVVV